MGFLFLGIKPERMFEMGKTFEFREYLSIATLIVARVSAAGVGLRARSQE